MTLNHLIIICDIKTFTAALTGNPITLFPKNSCTRLVKDASRAKSRFVTF